MEEDYDDDDNRVFYGTEKCRSSVRSLLEKAIKCPMLYGVTIVTRPRRKATKSSGREKIIVILFLVLIDF